MVKQALSRLGSSLKLRPPLEWLLRSTVALVLLSRAVQHLFWDAPFSALFWNQEFLEGPVKWALGWDWQRWATSPSVVRAMQGVVRVHGFLYLCIGILVLLPVRGARAQKAQAFALYFASLLLVGLAGLYSLDSKRQLGQLVEHSLACALPLVLGLVLRSNSRFAGAHEVALRLSIAGTFAGHGLYAAGFYELPGQFVTMVMQSLAVAEPVAISLLKVAGVLDFLVAFGVLLGIWFRKITLPVLAYATIWGCLTALSRLWSFFRWDMALDRLSQWLHEALLRLPHGLAPLFLLLVLLAWERARAQELALE